MRSDSVDLDPLVDCGYTKVIASRVGALGSSFVRAAKPGNFTVDRREKPPPDDSSSATAGGGNYIPRFPLGNLREFTLRELKKATRNFSQGQLIGRGGFGKVFRGRLSDGSLVAVKVSGKNSPQVLEAFQSEKTASCAIMGISHPNLVPAIGYYSSCKGKEVKVMIVYPFMARGDLHSYLGDLCSTITPLNWPTRKRIALEVARGISTLHELGIIHCDIKPSNVILDEDFNAHVGDFGLAKFIGLPHDSYNAAGFHGYQDSLHTYTTNVFGTIGYLAPECYHAFKYSRKSDVYGFGVTLLQLVTGKPVIDRSEKGMDCPFIVNWAKQLLKNEESLAGHVHPSLLGEYNESEAVELVQLGLVCLQTDPNERPLMPEVIAMMDGRSTALKQRWDNYDYTSSISQLRANHSSERGSRISISWTEFSSGSRIGDDDEGVLSTFEFHSDEEEPEENGIDGNQLGKADDFSSEESNGRHREGLTVSANSRSLENDGLAELVEVDPKDRGNPKQFEAATKLKEVLDQIREMELSHQAAMEEMHEKQILIMKSMCKMQELYIQKVNEMQSRVDQLKGEALLNAINLH